MITDLIREDAISLMKKLSIAMATAPISGSSNVLKSYPITISDISDTQKSDKSVLFILCIIGLIAVHQTLNVNHSSCRNAAEL